VRRLCLALPSLRCSPHPTRGSVRFPPARKWRRATVFAAAFAVTTVICFWTLILGGNPVEAFRVFYERTFEMQVDRRSPFCPRDWGQDHARGIPDLKWLQQLLQVALVVAALAVDVVPRRKSRLQLAALTAALLMGFELVLTHWAALYIAWFFPFLALALIAGSELGGVVPERSHVRLGSRGEQRIEVGLSHSPEPVA
jgi:hypothetical protein